MKKRNLNLAKKLFLNKETVVELGTEAKAMVNGGGTETLLSTPDCCVWLPTKAPSCGATCVPHTNPCGVFACATTE